MPHAARRSRSKAKGKGWSIVNKRSGKTVGHSSSKAKAAASARARDAAAHGWTPTRAKRS